jgi:hypothetical protein
MITLPLKTPFAYQIPLPTGIELFGYNLSNLTLESAVEGRIFADEQHIGFEFMNAKRNFTKLDVARSDLRSMYLHFHPMNIFYFVLGLVLIMLCAFFSIAQYANAIPSYLGLELLIALFIVGFLMAWLSADTGLFLHFYFVNAREKRNVYIKLHVYNPEFVQTARDFIEAFWNI